MKRISCAMLVVCFVMASVFALSEGTTQSEAPKGVNIGEYIKRYYQRKLALCEMTDIEMEFGTIDYVNDAGAYIDGIHLMLNEDNTVRNLMIQTSDLYNLIVYIPALYALRSDPSYDEYCEILVKAGLACDGYWLTSYEKDFENLKKGTKESPTPWGDYKAIYYEVNDPEYDIGSFIDIRLQ